MIVVASVAVLGFFWVVLIWAVKRDRGFVGLTPYDEARLRARAHLWAYTVAVRQAAATIARALTPAILKTTEAIRDWHLAFEIATYEVVDDDGAKLELRVIDSGELSYPDQG